MTPRERRAETQTLQVTMQALGPPKFAAQIVDPDIARIILDGPETLLRNPLLFDKLCEVPAKNIVPDIDAVKTILLVAFGSKLCINASATSTNLCVNSKSGAGKDVHVRACVDPFFTQESDLFHRTKITPQAFTYWKQKEARDDGFRWDGKVIVAEDCSRSLLDSDVFKTMSSGGSRATIVKEQRAIDIIIPGKPGIIITTAEAEPGVELLRRFPIIHLDESPEKTQQVVRFVAHAASASQKAAPSAYYRKVVAALQRVNVLVPFAEKLGEAFVKYDAIPFRTHIGRIIDFVKFSASLHQFQRERDADGNVIAEWKDWDLVRACIAKITTPSGFIPTHKQTSVLNNLNNLNYKSVPELLEEGVPYSERGLYKVLDRLTEQGILETRILPQEKRKDLQVWRTRTDCQSVQLPFASQISTGELNQLNQLNQKIVPTTDNSEPQIEASSVSSKGSLSSSSSVSSGTNPINYEQQLLALTGWAQHDEIDAQQAAELLGEQFITTATQKGDVMESRAGFLKVVR
ncbi:hypothetical protein HY493_04915 [Candidatus Woesearchaeota archaeon]|nr:hypothetical protein [Candidatus Woesearchaeota archaeon]